MQSKCSLPKRSTTLLRGDSCNWPAVTKLAIKIKTEVEEKASTHLELWERLDHLILDALEKRSEDQIQHENSGGVEGLAGDGQPIVFDLLTASAKRQC